MAVDVAALRRGTKSIHVRKPQLSEAFREASIREGADELLTLTAEESGSLRTFIDTKRVELERWGPPLVDADWHAFCQAICRGIEGKEWEALYHHNRELHQATGTQNPCDSQKAKPLWTMKAAKDRDHDFFYDPTHQKDIQGGPQTRLEVWKEHLKSQVAVLAKAFECLEGICER